METASGFDRDTFPAVSLDSVVSTCATWSRRPNVTVNVEVVPCVKLLRTVVKSLMTTAVPGSAVPLKTCGAAAVLLSPGAPVSEPGSRLSPGTAGAVVDHEVRLHRRGFRPRVAGGVHELNGDVVDAVSHRRRGRDGIGARPQ